MTTETKNATITVPTGLYCPLCGGAITADIRLVGALSAEDAARRGIAHRAPEPVIWSIECLEYDKDHVNSPLHEAYSAILDAANRCLGREWTEQSWQEATK